MSSISSSDVKKPMEQSNDDLSEAIEHPVVTTVNSDKNSTPPKNLSDMPVDVVRLIIERVNYLEQLVLRKVSKPFRALIDKQKPSCTSIYVLCERNFIECDYNAEVVYYESSYYDWEENKNLKRSEGDRVTINDDYQEIAFDDLAITLRNPKLQLESFWVFFNDRIARGSKRYSKFCDVLKSIGHQLSVRECRIDIECPSRYRSILPYLKPGVLEKITVFYHRDKDIWDYRTSLDTVKEVALLDQWKQAKELELVFSIERFPMEYATHFERFHFNEETLEGEVLIRIRDFLSTNHNFEYCLIDAIDKFNTQLLQSEVGRPAAANEHTEYVSHYSIPDSNDYLEFMFFDKIIVVLRKKLLS